MTKFREILVKPLSLQKSIEMQLPKGAPKLSGVMDTIIKDMFGRAAPPTTTTKLEEGELRFIKHYEVIVPKR